MVHKFKLITGVKVWEVQQLTPDTYKIIATGFPNLQRSNFTIKGSFESIKDKFRLATQEKTCKKGCVNKCMACSSTLFT